MEDIVNIVALIKEKNYGQLIPTILEVVDHVKETIGKCVGLKGSDVVLQVPYPYYTIDPTPIIKIGVVVAQKVIDYINSHRK